MGASLLDTVLVIVLLVAMALISATVCWIAHTLWSTRKKVLQMNRDNYFLCDVHGAIASSLVLTIYMDGNVKEERCPICYSEKETIAKRQFEQQLQRLQQAAERNQPQP